MPDEVMVTVDPWVEHYEELQKLLMQVGIDKNVIEHRSLLRKQILIHRFDFTDDEFHRVKNLIAAIGAHHV